MVNAKGIKLYESALKTLRDSNLPKRKGIDLDTLDEEVFFQEVEEIFIDQFVRSSKPWPTQDAENKAMEIILDQYDNNPFLVERSGRDLARFYLEKQLGELTLDERNEISRY